MNLFYSFLELARILWYRFVFIFLLVPCGELDILFILLDPLEVLAEDLRRPGFNEGLGLSGICLW